MPRKRLLRPERLRQVRSQFSWIDQCPVREGYLERCPAPALAPYLLLVTVADAQGLSYYGDATVCRLLSMALAHLEGARAALIEVGLIAYERPLYQVLALDPPASRACRACWRVCPPIRSAAHRAHVRLRDVLHWPIAVNLARRALPPRRSRRWKPRQSPLWPFTLAARSTNGAIGMRSQRQRSQSGFRQSLAASQVAYGEESASSRGRSLRGCGTPRLQMDSWRL